MTEKSCVIVFCHDMCHCDDPAFNKSHYHTNDPTHKYHDDSEYVSDIIPIKLIPKNSFIHDALNSPLNAGIETIDHFGVKIKKLRICVANPIAAVKMVKMLWDSVIVDKDTSDYLQLLPVDLKKLRMTKIMMWMIRSYRKTHKSYWVYGSSLDIYNRNYYGYINRILFRPHDDIIKMYVYIHGISPSDMDQISCYKIIDIKSDIFIFNSHKCLSNIYHGSYSTCPDGRCMYSPDLISILGFFDKNLLFYPIKDKDTYNDFDNDRYMSYENEQLKKRVISNNTDLNGYKISKTTIKYRVVEYQPKFKVKNAKPVCCYYKKLFDLKREDFDNDFVDV